MPDERPRPTADDALTKPMRIVELAGIFGVNRNLMSRIVRTMDGAERFGQLWRLPASKMPVEWRREHGLLDV